MSRRSGMIYLLLSTLVLALLVGACGTKKRVVQEKEMVASLSKRGFLRAYDQISFPPVVDAKGRIVVDNGYNRVTSSIRWSLRRDDAFVLSARPLGLMEAVRLTVNQTGFALVDRLNRRAFASDGASLLYQTIEGLTGYNPILLKYIAQQEPFSLKNGGGMGVLRKFDFSSDGRHYRFEERDRRTGATVVHLFSPRLTLLESRVMVPGVAEVTATYSDYVQMPTPLKAAPVATRTEVVMRILKGEKVESLRVQIELREPTADFSQTVDTSVPRGYDSLTVQELVRLVKEL